MAEYGIFRDAADHGLLESIHIIDTLADKGPLAEEVLIDIRHGPRVRVYSRVAGKNPGEPRAPGTGQANANAWLKNAVAFHHDSASGAKHRAVQWMGHGGDKPPGGITRQLSVSVQGDDILDRGQKIQITDNIRKATAGRTTKQGVEIGELSALAFIAHPLVFGWIPAARAMKQKKPLGTVRRILAVEPLYPRVSSVQQIFIIGHMLGRCVTKICQQGEMQVRVMVCQIMNLHGLDQPVNSSHTRQHRWNHHHRAPLGCNPRAGV